MKHIPFRSEHKRTRSILDSTCRLSKGGCGRKVEIVSESAQIVVFNALRKLTIKHRAVHADEPGDRAKVQREKFYRLRESLEYQCINQRKGLDSGSDKVEQL